MNRLIGILKKAYSSDAKLIATWLLACHAIAKALSWVISKQLKAPELYLGGGSTIRGSKYISFGRGIFVHGNLWLEAIPSYSAQIFTPKIEIGDFVSLSNNVHISSILHVIIKNHTLIGSGVYISDHNHGIYRGSNQSHPDEAPCQRQLMGGPVHIGENVWIGDNAVIVGPVVIGDGAVVAANSVVKNDVSPQTIVAGSPAKAIKRFSSSLNRWERI